MLLYRCDDCGAEEVPEVISMDFGEDVVPGLPESWVCWEGKDYCGSCLPGDYMPHGPHQPRDLTKRHPYMAGVWETIYGPQVAGQLTHPSRMTMGGARPGQVRQFKIIKGDG
jgi:hypothetical protein